VGSDWFVWLFFWRARVVGFSWLAVFGHLISLGCSSACGAESEAFLKNAQK
jgi:hypothetical protein